MSSQKMEKGLDQADTMALIKSCGRDLENLLESYHNASTLEELHAARVLISAESNELHRLNMDLLREIGVEINNNDNNIDDEDTSSDDDSFDTDSKGGGSFFTIPEMRFVPWTEANSLRSPPRKHVTIQIPQNQPTPADRNPSSKLPVTYGQKKTSADPDTKGKGPEEGNKLRKEFKRAGLPPSDSQPLEELPERIRICSLQLSIFLDYNIHDSTFNWSSYSRTPFVILRPFKFLVDKGEEIRQALDDLKKIRLERFPGRSEDEYDELWEHERPEDDIPPRVVDPHELSEAVLTALIKDLDCLTSFMDGYLKPTMTIGQFGHAFFSDLWFVYPARSLIYVKDKKVPHKIWKVIQRTGGRWGQIPSGKRIVDKNDGEWSQSFSPFVIDCFHLDYDGNRYVQTYRQIEIDHFEGALSVLSLPVIPVDIAEKAGLIDPRDLVARGEEFVKCTGPSHRQYVGRNQIIRPNGAKLYEMDADVPENATRHAEWIDSEVMVDFERALQEMPSWRPGISDLKLYKQLHQVQQHDKAFDGLEIDDVWDSMMSQRVMYEEWNKIHKWSKERMNPTQEEDLLLLPERVFAFVFRTRKWACLRIGKDNGGQEMLKKKQARDEPWRDLQLPDGHKRLVQSLIESHSTDKGASSLQFDLIRAKGKGLIILLHGVPGVGKTSTAECAAEAYKRPLLPITCGDLGTSPREVEKKLDEAFQLAQQWNCVLLLDEADIFLAQRSEHDIERNALVSVFLRVLEYYEGILFLTTNRVGVFDEAFKSRIHLPLYYLPLEWKYAKRIWSTYLKKLTSSNLVEIDEEDIMAYAENFFEKQSAKNSKIGPVWNGRQIRNAFQSAVALAGYKSTGLKIRLEREHFERVSKVSNEFNHYIWSIRNETDADKNARWGTRLDKYEADETIHMKPIQSTGPSGMMDISFGSQFSKPAPAGMPIMNPQYGLQQGNFFTGMAQQPNDALPGMMNSAVGTVGSHLPPAGRGLPNPQLQTQLYTPSQQQHQHQFEQQTFQQSQQQSYRQSQNPGYQQSQQSGSSSFPNNFPTQPQ